MIYGKVNNKITKALFRRLHIAPEAQSIVIAASAIAIFLFFIFPIQWPVFFIIYVCLLFFFREPQRKIPNEPEVIVSPANGTVTGVDIVSMPELSDEPFCRISIFLSIFNVHVQCAPYPGRVDKIEYKKGGHVNASRQDATIKNESNMISIKTEKGVMAVRQIAGLAARRIVCSVSAGNSVAKGEKLGIIMFGSKVELYIPVSMQLLVKIGDKITDGKSVVAAAK